MNGQVSFPPGERWNGSREIVEFEAEFNGKRISCAVSFEALSDNFDGDRKQPLKSFKENRSKIEALATKFIQRQRFENDGSILVRTADC